MNDKPKHIEVLLKHGADPNISDGFSQFYHVARKMNADPAYGKLLINKYTIEIVCIQIIIYFSVLSTREKYFFNNFNINATTQGFTAFHYAAIYHNIESLKVLINYGADPYIKTVTGHKPIDLVTDDQIYDLLLDYEKNVSFYYST